MKNLMQIYWVNFQ